MIAPDLCVPARHLNSLPGRVVIPDQIVSRPRFMGSNTIGYSVHGCESTYLLSSKRQVKDSDSYLDAG